MKNKLLVVFLIGLLLMTGLVLTVCDLGANCIGTGECTVTISQGSSGLYVDNSADQSSCGDLSELTSGGSTGCKVADMLRYGSTNRKAGTHKCNC